MALQMLFVKVAGFSVMFLGWALALWSYTNDSTRLNIGGILTIFLGIFILNANRLIYRMCAVCAKDREELEGLM